MIILAKFEPESIFGNTGKNIWHSIESIICFSRKVYHCGKGKTLDDLRPYFGSRDFFVESKKTFVHQFDHDLLRDKLLLIFVIQLETTGFQLS